MTGAQRADAQLSLEVCEKAMEWWLELQGNDVDSPTLAAFTSWRNAHSSHELAWQRAQALSGKLSAFRQAGDSRLARRALLTPTEGISRRRAIKGLAVLLAAGTSAWSAKDATLVQHFRADYSTGVGEQHRVALSSQLEVLLNTRSALNAGLVDHQWRIDLLRGEVLIDTSVSPPLLLKTDQLQATAASARFSARLFDNGTTVLEVFRGSMQITPRQASGSVVLNAGEQARFSPLALLERSTLQASSAAWSQGMIVAHGQPLRAFLEEVARYRRGHLGCDEALANLRVWGTYPLADSDRVVDAVAQTLKLDVQRFTRLWVNLSTPASTV
ncbi:DUF4880 domain-containing protein [Pseudomonas sp. NPDC090202]|uniref:DUF4880 domain-containing protein n=1 Tax=unclassified Pseudomonas TaxID=196821 RepID=UPI0037FC5186